MSTPDPTKDKTGAAAKVDLRALIKAKATRASESVTVFLDQAAATEVRDLEKELRALAASDPKQVTLKRGKDIAKAIEAARERMAESAVTFRFRALTRQQALDVVEEMGDSEDQDEYSQRNIAAMCVEPAGVTYETLNELRDGIGGALYVQTIVAAADRAGVGELSVPFSLSASSILSIKK
jgi:hypothetical protein